LDKIEVLTPKAETILGILNDIQKTAATHKDGPLVVFAGAGSGKTRIITSRIALLMESGVRPPQILAVTFTNKAAAEMRERVAALTPQGAGCHIGTFHSSCAKWLREFAPELGFSSDFTIYDDKDTLSAIKSILKEFNVTAEDEASATDYKSAISKAKTFAWSPADAEKYAEQYSGIFPKLGVQVYKRYQEILAASNAMDFGDLLLNMLLLLKRNEGVRRILQRRYSYVMVDEYQDTNPTQFELISYLVNDRKNLFVVGDDDQSIYSWRGADPTNILEFGKHYPGAVTVNLEQNYRCTKNIVTAASSMIANNKQRAEKTLWTDNEKGDQIGFVLEYSGEMEAWSVIDHIKNEEKQFSYTDFAIFYRTNAQSRQMEEVLRREQIPYRIYGSLRFYDRAEIKDILAYLRLCLNPNDDVAFNRIVNVPARGIGAKAQSQILENARKKQISMLEMARTMVSEKIPRLSGKLAVFIKIIDSIRNEIKEASLEEVVQIVLNQTDYKSYIEKKFPDQMIDKIANIHEIAAALSDHQESNKGASLSDWMQDVSLVGSEEQSEAGVTLMTLHSAKGLEFKRVFIIGVEDNLLPHSNSMDNEFDIEEERRLLYVGVTRAREKLTLLCAQKRRVYNNWMANPPSRFLSEIPSELFDSVISSVVNSTQASNQPAYQNGNSKSTSDHDSNYSHGYNQEENYQQESSSSQLIEGVVVSHPTYGKGTIEAMESEFGVHKATVNFNEWGKRKVSCSQLEANECHYDFDI